jgi:Arc/MetJ-type ribon-helix-helix transcriptional regulator
VTDVLVSLRIPAVLLDELKELQEKEHFMDLSELVRRVVRKRWLGSKDPILREIRELRAELREELGRGVQ